MLNYELKFQIRVFAEMNLYLDDEQILLNKIKIYLQKLGKQKVQQAKKADH